MYSKLMKENFNSHASTYNNHCQVQKIMVRELCEIIKKENEKFSSIFEIGCGTGNLSKLLIKNFNPDNLYLNDICPNMLNETKKTLFFNNAEYINEDFEKINLNEKYDLIISNAVFQWFKNMKLSFRKIYKALNSNGVFSFAMFVKNTFCEVEDSFTNAFLDMNLKFENPLLEFYESDFIKKKLDQSGFKINNFFIKQYYLFYKHPLDFLKSLRELGAGNFKDKHLNYGIIKKMIYHYIKKYYKENKIPVTYNVLYCTALKKTGE